MGGCTGSKAAEVIRVPQQLPKYVQPDPDLGWRNSNTKGYPHKNLLYAFHNERSGENLVHVNIASLAINIAARAAKLANKFGVTDQRDCQSSSQLLELTTTAPPAREGNGKEPRVSAKPVKSFEVARTQLGKGIGPGRGHAHLASEFQTKGAGTKAQKLHNTDRNGVCDHCDGDCPGLCEKGYCTCDELHFAPRVGGDPEQAKAIKNDMNRLLKRFGCPKFGWTLCARMASVSRIVRVYPEVFIPSLPTIVAIEDRTAALAELASLPDQLQMLRDSDGKLVVCDVGEIAVNVAEQLNRLERSEPNKATANPHSQCLPRVDPADPESEVDMAGWHLMDNSLPQNSILSPIPVASPEGDALMIYPEELIMHVASWIQQTYLTAPAF